MGKLVGKVGKTLKEEGVISLAGKTKRYIQYNSNKKNRMDKYRDILFVNGCTLPHPERYRVDHQMEQLESNGLSVDKVFYEAVNIERIKNYRVIVIFRCPITPKMEELVKKAKYFNKKVFFDIDDLVIDTKYTDTIPFVQSMGKADRATYDDGVIRMGKMLEMSDYVITTTSALAREIKKTFKKDVIINKNVASEKMVELSLEAQKIVKKDDNKVVIGYLSGSITHNPDFELIKKPLLRIMSEYQNVELKISGYLDLPKDFEKYQDRIQVAPFGNWQLLPKTIASLDINLAPITESIFNEAKSENKWTEAALCRVVTVASNFGAFKEAIKNNKTGVLCGTEEEWYEKLKELVENKEKREAIADEAFRYVMKKYVTTYTGLKLAKEIESRLAKNIAFVLPSTNISGGVNVVIKHCNILRDHGYDVTIINSEKDMTNIVNMDGEINVVSMKKSHISARFYAMVATLYTTLKFVKGFPDVIRKFYLVQNFETNFCNYGSEVKRQANATYNAPGNIEYITISKWCQDWLKEDYEKDAKYAPNGIDVDRFEFKKRSFGDKIKILVEGNSKDYYKNVDESFRIIEKLDKSKYEISYLSYEGKPKKWYYVDNFYHRVPHDEVMKVYGENDILLKSSILESFSYPPLEMMATGGYCVVAPNEGNIEYLKDKENCLLYKQGDIDSAVNAIEELASNKDLQKTISENAIKTVKERDWKKVEEKVIELYS